MTCSALRYGAITSPIELRGQGRKAHKAVMFHNAATLAVAGNHVEIQSNVFSHSRAGGPS